VKWDDRIGRRLKLRDLHVLLAVAEMGSMGKAAERLAISQPSVSKAIADMEHAVGVRLLDRTARGVEPTDYGRALLRRSLGAFDELRQGIKDIEGLADPTVGEVRVGCPEAISAGLLSAAIDVFSRRYPKAIVTVTPADNMSLEFRRVRDRQVDFLLGRAREPFAEDDLNAEVLYRDRMYIVSSRKSHWARRRKIMLAELVGAPWLLAPSMFGLILAEAFQASGLPVPKINVGCYSTHQTISLLATNRFVSALSGSQLRFNADRFSIKLLPVDFATHAWPVAIITLKSRMISPVVQTFMNCVREAAKPMVKIGASFGKVSTMPSHA
jgi:DNA-binding transcriptional LysR family regulator